MRHHKRQILKLEKRISEIKNILDSDLTILSMGDMMVSGRANHLDSSINKLRIRKRNNMATATETNQTQNEPKVPTVTRKIFDLDKFTDIRIVQTVDFTPVTNVDEVLERLTNESDRFIKIVNDGLLEEAKREARRKPLESGLWHTYTSDSNDNQVINGVYNGIAADLKKVNATVLSLAKTIFGFNGDMSKDQKRKAKADAKAFIQSNETIREGLKKNAALDMSQDDEDEVEETED